MISVIGVGKFVAWFIVAVRTNYFNGSIFLVASLTQVIFPRAVLAKSPSHGVSEVSESAVSDGEAATGMAFIFGAVPRIVCLDCLQRVHEFRTLRNAKSVPTGGQAENLVKSVRSGWSIVAMPDDPLFQASIEREETSVKTNDATSADERNTRK